MAEAIDFCEYYALEMRKLGAPQHRDVPGEDNRYFYEPRGVSVIIAPWNFPLAILTGMATAALVAGNTVILKPAEQSSIIAAKLMECLQAAGLPPGVANFLPGDGEEIGPTLVQHPDVALIAFTGSLKVALLINEQASKTPGGQNFVKKVIAEMGGKNAIIVDSDADLDEAVKGVVDSAFGFGGQKCSAGSRAIVLDGIYDQFLNMRLVEATKSLAGGETTADDPGCSLGPVIDAEARSRIMKYIEAGKQQAKLAHQTDLGALMEQGYFVPPTIFADVPENAAIAQEEIFGPVLSVIRRQRPGRRHPHRERYEVRADRRVLQSEPEPPRTGEAPVPRGQPVHQPQMHRGAGRSPAVRRVQAERDRLEGRRPGLPVAVRLAAHDHREPDAPRLRAGDGRGGVNRRSPARGPPWALRPVLLRRPNRTHAARTGSSAIVFRRSSGSVPRGKITNSG